MLLREAGNVVPMAVLEPLSGILAGKGRNILEYRPDFADDQVFGILPIAPPLGSIYSSSCIIDVENEVFEFDGQQIVFDNSTNQLTAKAPGGMKLMWRLRSFARRLVRVQMSNVDQTFPSRMYHLYAHTEMLMLRQLCQQALPTLDLR